VGLWCDQSSCDRPCPQSDSGKAQYNTREFVKAEDLPSQSLIAKVIREARAKLWVVIPERVYGKRFTFIVLFIQFQSL
jgi:hypothetical protein